jgi:hypothetical protein
MSATMIPSSRRPSAVLPVAVEQGVGGGLLTEHETHPRRLAPRAGPAAECLAMTTTPGGPNGHFR